MSKVETPLEREISSIAWDYSSREYRARLYHKRFAYTTVWRLLKKRTLEEAIDALEKMSQETIQNWSTKQNKEVHTIYKQALEDIEEAKRYAALDEE